MPRRGVIYTVAPSPRDINTIWAGTDDGLIHRTTDGGKNWKDVTPPGVTSWSKVSLMDAGHFDAKTAYAAVNRIRLDDLKPHIYRTHDGGATWTEITAGLPDEPINAVREDPVRKGLLFAGSECAVYVSFDDGDHWQSLRLNMPATSIRDLVVKDNDLVVGTHGRSFWILDGIAPLRQATQADMRKAAVLYAPPTAVRVRWNMNSDTPLPQEEPAGQNPPDGAIIDYYLPADAKGGATLEILDAKGAVVRSYSSSEPADVIPPQNIPLYWIRPQQRLSAAEGAHRFFWDLHYAPLALPPSYPIAAIYQQTAPDPTSPWVLPGTYSVRLTVNGASITKPLVVTMDPRVKAPAAAIKLQHDLSLTCYRGRIDAMALLREVRNLRAQIKDRSSAAGDSAAAILKALDARLGIFESAAPEGKSIGALNGAFASVLNILHDADRQPTSQAIAAVASTERNFKEVKAAYAQWKSKELAEANARLAAAGAAPVKP
jgi:hypothetical protein